MNAVRWVVVGVLAGGSVGFFLGAVLGVVSGEHKADRDWRALFVELGVDHGNELQALEDVMAKQDQAVADLQRNIGLVWDAGVMAGQTFQADRQENNLD